MLPKRERLRKRLKHLRNLIAGRAAQSRAVFVFGDMRSGTNMLKDCFSRTPRTAVFNESDEEAFDDFVLRDLSVISGLIERSPATHVIFKALADSGRARELLDRFPGSSALWIYRRYQDVVNSTLRTRHWKSARENLRLTLDEPARARWRRLNLTDEQLRMLRAHYDRGIDDASSRALIWCIRNEFLFSQQLDRDPRVLPVSYEQLVSHPGHELERAWNHLGLRLRQRYYAHFTTRSVRRHADPGIDPEIAALADSVLHRLHESRAHRQTHFGSATATHSMVTV